MDPVQDEMLARFVVGSHVRHHPNGVEKEDKEDEEESTVSLIIFFADAIYCQLLLINVKRPVKSFAEIILNCNKD